MTTIRELEKKKETLLVELKKIDDDLAVREKLNNFVCKGNGWDKNCNRFYEGGCGEITEIKNVHIDQTRNYEKPHGCTEGDYWYDGEVRFNCQNCGARIRAINDEQKGFVEKNKHLFAKINKVNERRCASTYWYG